MDLKQHMYKALFFKAQCISQVKYTDMNTSYVAPLLSKYTHGDLNEHIMTDFLKNVLPTLDYDLNFYFLCN